MQEETFEVSQSIGFLKVDLCLKDPIISIHVATKENGVDNRREEMDMCIRIEGDMGDGPLVGMKVKRRDVYHVPVILEVGLPIVQLVVGPIARSVGQLDLVSRLGKLIGPTPCKAQFLGEDQPTSCVIRGMLYELEEQCSPPRCEVGPLYHDNFHVRGSCRSTTILGSFRKNLNAWSLAIQWKSMWGMSGRF